MEQKPRISWVLPIFNEEKNIPTLYKALELLRSRVKQKYTTEFIFVDDGSKDRSMELLTELQAKDKDITVLSFSRNFGHQMAITAGLDHATGDAVIFMDSDLQDPPEVCFELIRTWEEGYDVAYAKRRTRQDGFLKTQTAYWFYRILRAFSDIDIPADTGDFRLISKQVADTLRSFPERHRFIRGLISYIGFKQKAVLFDRRARSAGETGYSIKKMFRLAEDALTGFSTSPISIIGSVGNFLAGAGLLGVIGFAIANRSSFMQMSYNTLLTGIVLVAMSIIGQYTGRTYQQIQGRPLYILKAILKN